ncbi:MAG TPA: hypothetical protein VK539_12385 [Myxococcaceae bacterium]|nr:hypothetical protein [Myxococcaceae bacterium]
MKIDGNLMGPRMSTNLSVQKQSSQTTFGQRVQAGVNAVGGAVSSGVGLATGMLPGGGIVSAAVSSMSVLSQGATGHAGNQYSATIPGGATTGGGAGGSGVPSVNTTVGAPGGVAIPGTGGGSGAGGLNIGGGSNVAGEFSPELSGMFAEQKNLLKMQAALQHEGQRFTAISNVMKTRHDTIKNSIGNIR